MKKTSAAKKTASTRKSPAHLAPVPAAAAAVAAPVPHHEGTAAFLREVDEAMHQERLLHFWHAYKWMLMGGLLAMLLGVAGWQGWGAWQRHQARTQAANWYAFTELSAEPARREALAKFLGQSSGGYRALAAFTQAGMVTAPAEKAKSYALVYNDGAQPRWLQDVARLNAALALMGSDDAAAKSQLELLTQNAGETPGPAYAPALELLALQAQKAGDVMAARGYTQRLLEQSQITPDMRQRALQRMGAFSTLQQ